MIGTTLSHYEITAELGRGGMGIVYKARDTKLDREVAIKILPSAALASADDRERFYREAKSAAQLHHPNIASVFEIDEAVPEGGDAAEPRPFIAMEYIAGGTLQDRIKEAPLSLSDAVKIASQVAEALKAAHAKDIVHRDIKSANVMITEDGVAKVLDFGLAKTNQSTMLTRMGSTLGTVAYMSPEQARGQEVDGRTDLYSLGTMLYEMVAGRLPFAGEYEQAVVYSILNEPPEPLTSLRTGVPMQLEWIVNKLMAKDADYRYQSAADLLADLKSLDLSGSGMSRRSMPAASAVDELPALGIRTSSTRMPAWGWAAIALALVMGVSGTWFLASDSSPKEPAVIRSSIDIGVPRENVVALDVSPSGRMLAFSTREEVRVRDLQTEEEWSISQTAGITAIKFSPSEEWLLLQRQGMVMRVQVRGGSPVEVVPVSSFSASPHWGPEGTVIYQNGARIESISLTTGEVKQLVPPDSTYGYDDLYVTRDQSTLIIAVEEATGGSGIRIFDLPSGDLRGTIDVTGIEPWYVETGHLLYTTQSKLYGVPVDLENAVQTGPVVPLIDWVTRTSSGVTRDGHLLYFEQPIAASQITGELLEKVLWDGTREILPPEAAVFDDIDINQDGRRVVAGVITATRELWVLDVVSGVSNRITFDVLTDSGVWTPKADSILYVNRIQGRGDELILVASDGSGGRVLYQSGFNIREVDMHPDGNKIVMSQGTASEGFDLAVLDLTSGEAETVFDAQLNIRAPRFSPDGRFVSYTTSARNSSSGEPQVWIQPSDFSGARWDVSRGPGIDPLWAPDGSAIYYRWINQLKKVSISAPGQPVVLGAQEVAIEYVTRIRDYQILPDGSGFIHTVSSTDNEQNNTLGLSNLSGDVQVVFNWLRELEVVSSVN